MLPTEQRDEWIEQVLQSASGSRRAQPSEGFENRLRGKLKGKRSEYVPMVQLGIAAGICLLLVNAATIIHYEHSAQRNVSVQNSAYRPPLSVIQNGTTYNY